VTVRLTPKGGRDAIDGIERLADGKCVLKARVRAAPSEGEANDALTRLLAQTVGVAPRQVAIVGGATSRVKRLLIRGDVPTVAAALERSCSADGQNPGVLARRVGTAHGDRDR
jgi:uncharacterized protein YggU (UPF0235/DUF167 family)